MPSHEGNSVRFSVGRAMFSYGGFYIGFGLFVTAYLLFSALLAWQLGALSAKFGGAIQAVSSTFFVVQVASVGLSWMYFSAVPVAFSAVIAACTGGAAWSLRPAAHAECVT